MARALIFRANTTALGIVTPGLLDSCGRKIANTLSQMENTVWVGSKWAAGRNRVVVISNMAEMTQSPPHFRFVYLVPPHADRGAGA